MSKEHNTQQYCHSKAFPSAEKAIFKEVTQYFESVVIDPKSVVDAELEDTGEWKIGDSVEFSLGECGNAYSGALRWIGRINGTSAAALTVDTVGPKDPLRRYFSSTRTDDLLKLPHADNMVMVLRSSLSKICFKEENDFYRRMFRSINKTKEFSDFFLDSLCEIGVKVPKTVISGWSHPISLDRYPRLLPRLIQQQNYYAIAVLLDKFISSDNDTVPLLEIAKYYLMKGDHELFSLATKKCRDANVILDNGDTFLTSLVKDGGEDVVNRVIGTNAFDVNKTNTGGESPLVLACGRLMVSTVRLLMSSGAVASAQDNRAMSTVMDLRKNISDIAMLQQAFTIIEILAQGIKLDSVVTECKVCMDRKVDTALDCGHTLCKVCSENVLRCPECYTNITKRMRIYLN